MWGGSEFGAEGECEFGEVEFQQIPKMKSITRNT